MADNKSLREHIAVWLVDTFSSMEEALPVEDPYGIKFSIVSRKPIDKLVPGKKSALGIYDVGETKQHKMFPVTEVRLTVAFEIHLYSSDTNTTTTELNAYLAAVERKLMEDQTLGGLAYDIAIIKSESDIVGQYEKQVAAMLEIEIKYRHKTGDPRKKVGE